MNHFMPPSLITNQFQTLEPPVLNEEAIVIDAAVPINDIVECAVSLARSIHGKSADDVKALVSVGRWAIGSGSRHPDWRCATIDRVRINARLGKYQDREMRPQRRLRAVFFSIVRLPA